MSKYDLRSARVGKAAFLHDSRRGQLSWEMLAGKMDLCVYGKECYWELDHGGREPIELEDLVALVREFAAEHRLNLRFEHGATTFEVLNRDVVT